MIKLIMLLMLALPTLGATSTGTVLLQGTVPQILDLTVTLTTIASSLPLDTTQVDTKVADIGIKSNSSTGYSLSITSANNGELVHQSLAAAKIAYTLKLGTESINLLVGTVLSYVDTTVDIVKDLVISYIGVPHEDRVAGTYTDTVTIVITAN